MASYDAIVIGGGVVGASTAYHLVAAGARTLLVDRSSPGRATDAGAGILSTATVIDHPHPIHRFVARAAQYYPRLVERLESEGGGDTGYAVRGSLNVAVSEDEIPQFEAIKASLVRGSGGGGLRVLSPDEARALFPPLGRVHGAAFEPRRARVDGRLLAAAMLRTAEGHGLEARRASAERIVVERDAARGVRVGGEAIGAGYVVIAAGAWARMLGEQIGVAVPVEPQRGQIVHLDLPGEDTTRWPIVSGLREHYMVPWDDSRLAVGATRESGAGYEVRSTVEGVMEVLNEALRVAPGLKSAGVREIRVGLRPASADGLPILGRVPGVRNLLLATGHGPLGLQLGPYSGKVVADLIISGAPDADLSPFGLARFH